MFCLGEQSHWKGPDYSNLLHSLVYSVQETKKSRSVRLMSMFLKAMFSSMLTGFVFKKMCLLIIQINGSSSFYNLTTIAIIMWHSEQIFFQSPFFVPEVSFFLVYFSYLGPLLYKNTFIHVATSVQDKNIIVRIPW